MTERTLLCLGYGYSARALGARLATDARWRVVGTTRDAGKGGDIERAGVDALVIERLEEARDSVARATHILVSIGPADDGDPVVAALGDDIARAPRLEWIGYLSATSVYGDADGDWVDETSPLRPTTERGRKRIAAEAQWRDLAAAHDLPLAIFRLGGIYGSGRSAIDTVRAGRARRIVKPGQMFNRIHVEDIARALTASMERDARTDAPRYDADAIYNVVDDEPAPPQDVIAYAAELLDVDPPAEIPFEQADLTPMSRSFYAENKKVRNEKVKARLGGALMYPHYRAGVKSILERYG